MKIRLAHMTSLLLATFGFILGFVSIRGHVSLLLIGLIFGSNALLLITGVRGILLDRKAAKTNTTQGRN